MCRISHSNNANNDVADEGRNTEQEEQFGRPPSGFEIEYARAHGWAALADRTHAVANRGGPSSQNCTERQEPSSDGDSSGSTSSSADLQDAS
jgi:hypothetical protein